MHHDLIIKNGLVVDGSGLTGYHADVAIKDGRIMEIGRVSAAAAETIDAEGHVVAPGFVDGHTHLDAQIFWDQAGSTPCFHGVTSVVMGNCGFTLAPCRKSEVDLVLRNLERAEDMDRAALLAGVPLNWETYPQFLDVIDKLPKGINYAGYIGHSAVRTYVMGGRAFTDEASSDEIATMAAMVREAIMAGAIGFSTSRSANHTTSDDKPVASRIAAWDEMVAIVREMGQIGKGIFQISRPTERGPTTDSFFRDLACLSAETGRPVTFGMATHRSSPDGGLAMLDLLDEAADQGAQLFVQLQTRMVGGIASFETRTPFDDFPIWSELRELPLAEQKIRLRDPVVRRALIDSANQPPQGRTYAAADLRPPDWDWFFVMHNATGPYRSVAEVARERGAEPVEVMIDLALESELKQMFLAAAANENGDEVLRMLRHRRTLATFSDAGAHVSQIESSLQTHLLSYWVRDRQAFSIEQAIKMITHDTADFWCFHDRGLLRVGYAADVVIFDPKTVGASMPEVVRDLPAGAMRLRQGATGFLATMVNGQITLRNGRPTGALPGQLIRV